MRTPSAWVLNLDADNELSAKTHTPPSARTIVRLPELVRSLSHLLGPHDVVLGESDRLTPGTFAGRAWCPTPGAIARLSRAGAIPVPAPDLSVLRRVNHRKFAADLGQTLPFARYVLQMEELLAVVAGESPTGHWLLKRPFGFAGRGRRKVRAGALEEAAHTWVLASLRENEGLQVEPWVPRCGDFARHGYVSTARKVWLGEPTAQECDEAGAWLRSARTTELDEEEGRALASSARLSGEALADAGYFGPFGVDAFRWKDGARFAFNARSEINARYSMGWAIGMGTQRPDLDAAPT